MIKEIEFRLENLESVTFPSDVIGLLEIDDVGIKVARVACNAFERYQKAGSFAIELFSEGNMSHERFSEAEPDTWFQRLAKFHDITSVVVRYHGGAEDEFRLVYACENDDTDENLYQKNYISACNNLYIVVHPSKTIDDFFDVSRVDNEEHMEFLKAMFGAGEEHWDNETQ